LRADNPHSAAYSQRLGDWSAGRQSPYMVALKGVGGGAGVGGLVLEDGAGFGDVGVEVVNEVGELLFYYAAAEF
jgi:hypothetical protein